MTTIVVSGYKHASDTLRMTDLRQALYDEGAVIMQDVLLVLHGAPHRARRLLELRVFQRDFLRYYEHSVFPATLAQTMAQNAQRGHADLIDLASDITMNLTADFAGVDRPQADARETSRLRRIVAVFGEGATLVHSTRDKEEVRAEVRAALDEFRIGFYQPSMERRRALVARFLAGELTEDQMPRDILTVLLRNEDKLELAPDLMLREIAFYLQAGSHSTANATAHAFHDVVTWCADHPQDARRVRTDPLFLQRCVHESLRLHPASPVAQRRPSCPVTLAAGDAASESDTVVVDMAAANRDPAMFGADADEFNPHRVLPAGLPSWGLTFGVGAHTCLGRDLDGGMAERADTDPATHQYGIITLLVRALLERNARPDPEHPATRSDHTNRPNWGSYPILLDA